jgi:putative membrane protein
LSYGLLVSQPVSEILAARGGLRGRVPRATTVAWMAFGSMLYELIEWMAAVGFGGDLGIAYLGTQGDPWDAQKDMALALLGSLLWACVSRRRL